MSGIFFYWVAWLSWVVVTFFLEKGKVRTEAAIFLLVVIMFSDQYISVDPFRINSSLILILLYAYYKFSQFSCTERMKEMGLCLMISVGYAGFSILCLRDPAVLWFPKTWVLAGFVFIVTGWTGKSPLPLKCSAAAIGLGHGNLLFILIMRQFSTFIPAGGPDFLDILTLSFVIIITWQGYRQAAKMLNDHFRKMWQKGHLR